MEPSKKRLISLARALQQFEKSCVAIAQHKHQDDYEFYRDSLIQRFEFTYDLFWKVLKDFLHRVHGVEAATPKSVFRGLLEIKFIDESEKKLLFQMVDDRNMTSHTYHEELAEEIAERALSYYNIIKLIAKRSEEAS